MPHSHPFNELVTIVRVLRGPDGCPWDRAQTFLSLTPYVIEEAYELSEALSTNDHRSICEELGDVLLHVVMIGLMAEEMGIFSLESVISGVSEKMIRRHPHVFGDTQVDGVEGVLHNWEAIKKTENAEKGGGSMASIPASLPALMQAYKIQKRAAKLGFDWPDLAQTVEKVQEEFQEVLVERERGDDAKDDLELEWGDLLFSMVNVARKLNIDPEQALRKSNQKFKTRFTHMEDQATRNGEAFASLSLDQQEGLWQASKVALD